MFVQTPKSQFIHGLMELLDWLYLQYTATICDDIHDLAITCVYPEDEDEEDTMSNTMSEILIILDKAKSQLQVNL